MAGLLDFAVLYEPFGPTVDVFPEISSHVTGPEANGTPNIKQFAQLDPGAWLANHNGFYARAG